MCFKQLFRVWPRNLFINEEGAVRSMFIKQNVLTGKQPKYPSGRDWLKKL